MRLRCPKHCLLLAGVLAGMTVIMLRQDPFRFDPHDSWTAPTPTTTGHPHATVPVEQGDCQQRVPNSSRHTSDSELRTARLAEESKLLQLLRDIYRDEGLLQSNEQDSQSAIQSRLRSSWDEVIKCLNSLELSDSASREGYLRSLSRSRMPEFSEVLNRRRVDLSRAPSVLLPNDYSDDTLPPAEVAQLVSALDEIEILKLSTQCTMNEKSAFAALRCISTCEEEFKSKNEDKVYWCRDVSSLLRASASRASSIERIKLLHSIAYSDLFPLIPMRQEGRATIPGGVLEIPALPERNDLRTHCGFNYFMIPTAADKDRLSLVDCKYVVAATPTVYRRTGRLTFALMPGEKFWQKDFFGRYPASAEEISRDNGWMEVFPAR